MAARHLSKADPQLARLIKTVGPCGWKPDGKLRPFEMLVRAVANQQLNGKAATTILNRFRGLFPGRRFPSAEEVGVVDDAAIRACGFSRAKIASIRDLAHHAQVGTIPTARRMRGLSDDEIVERLTQVRGVGRWTVEMLLIFQLGRPDVLPVDDFGVRNGFRLVFEKDEMPKPKEVMEYGERWRPYRSVASWYLWRAVEVWPR